MNNIQLIADSTCDLSQQLIEENKVNIVPLVVQFGNESYKDGLEIHPADIYKRVDETGVLPKTGAPSPLTIEEEFKKVLDSGKDVLFITISSEFSSVYVNGLSVRNSFPPELQNRIMIIDSRNLSTGIGLLVLRARRDIDKGMSLEEIESDLLSIREKVNAEFVTERLDYLYKGGRCSGLAYVFGKPLKIKPVIKVCEGKMVVHKLIRGKDGQKGWDLQLEEISKEIKNNNIILEDIFITHTSAYEGLAYIKERLEKIVDPSLIKVTEAGCVVTSHCGQGTIGILYIKKKN